jgi:site-specific DNA-methyltransferase (adenine-specific)
MSAAPLARLDRAGRMLAEAKTLDDVLEIRDLAEVARQYARTVGLGLEAQNQAAEVKIRAERMAGVALAELEKHGGGRPGKTPPIVGGVSEVPRTAPTLAELGISWNQSARYQAVARVPESEFEAWLARTKARGRELTSVELLQIARAYRPPRPLPPIPAATLPGNVRIDVGDARCLALASGIVHLQVCSPPYAVEKSYAGGGDVDPAEREPLMAASLAELYRVAVPSGRLCVVVPFDVNRPVERELYGPLWAIARAVGWRYKTTITWREGNISKSVARGSFARPSAPSVISRSEAVIVFYKQPGWKRTPPPGVAPDITDEEHVAWTAGDWELPGESRAWEGHPAAYPLELAYRLIKLYSWPGDTVLDGFAGSGTTVLAAQHLGRVALGFDVASEYVDSARRRLAAQGKQVR